MVYGRAEGRRMVETGGDNGISGIFLLLPFLVLGLGIVFVYLAFRDERGPKDPAGKFMSRANHPLRHVQVALNTNRKRARTEAREAAQEKAAETSSGDDAPKPEPPERKRRPPWLRGL